MFKPISTNIFPVLCGVSLAKLAAPMMNFNPGGQLTMPIRPGVEGKVRQSGVNRRGQPYLIVEGPDGPYMATQGRRGLKWLKLPQENVARVPDYTTPQMFGEIWRAQQLGQWASRLGLSGGGAMDPQTAMQMEMLRLLKEQLQRPQQPQAGGQQGGQMPAQQQAPTQPEPSQPTVGQQAPAQQPTETVPQTSTTTAQPQGGQAPAAQPAAEQTAFARTPFTQPGGFTPPKAPKLTPPQLPQTKLRSTLESPQWA